jgi:voltage-gated potassium channel
MPAGGTSEPRSTRDMVRSVFGTLFLVAVLTTIYYVLPVPGRLAKASWVILFSVGILTLAVLITLTVVRLVRAGPDTRIVSLVVLLCVAVLFFSYADVVLAKAPGEFVQLHTRTDALYFAVSTLATVGFGDVHASGQLARTAATVQILFNLVFLGIALTTLTGWLRHRAGHLRGSAGASHHDQP